MEEDFYPTLRGFACPQIGLDKGFMETLVVEHARQIGAAFLDRYRTDLAGGITEVFERWLSGEAGFDTAWHRTFGDLYAALMGSAKDVAEIRRCAAAFALRLHECGYGGDWELMQGVPVCFSFDRWTLPTSSGIQVQAAPRQVRIGNGSGLTDGVTFRREENDWEAEGDCVPRDAASPRTGCTVLTRRSISGPTAARLLSNDVYDFSDPSAAVTDEKLMAATCDSAMNLISRFAGLYNPWVRQVTKELLPVPVVPGRLHSASDKFSPGVICVSNQECPTMLAELLVHESTHQYCYAAQRMGPIDDGSDPSLYYSPFRHMHRPIAAIVTAYHAFANILLLYRTARASGLAAEQTAVNCDERIQDIGDQLGVLEQALRKSTALSPIGRALWEPLYELVHAE